MKKMYKILIFVFAATIMFGSCTMEKRKYLSGYNVQWKKGNPNSPKTELASKANESLTKKSEPIKIETSENETIKNDNVTTESNDNLIASVADNQIIVSQKDKNIFVPSNNELSSNKEKQVKPTLKSEFKKGAKMIASYSDDPKTNGSALTGFILSLVGLFLFGFILGVLAIIFSAIGLGKIKKDSSKWKGKGLAIAGLIIGIIDIIGWLILIALIL